ATIAFNLFMFFGIGVSYAITPLVAEASGKNDHDRIVDTLRHGLVINFINACFLVTVVLLGKEILYHINQPPEVVVKALPYLDILMFSLIPVLIYQSFRQFAEGMSNTRIARSEEHTSELQSRENLVCRLLLEKKKERV